MEEEEEEKKEEEKEEEEKKEENYEEGGGGAHHGGGHVGGGGGPARDEVVLGPGHHVPQVALVVLLLGQGLDRGHQHVVVAKEVVQDEPREGVAEALVGGRVQHLDVHGDVEALPGGGEEGGGGGEG